MWTRLLAFCVLFHLTLGAETISETPAPKSSLVQDWNEVCSSHRVKSWYIDALEKTDLLESTEQATLFPMLHLFEVKDSEGRFDRLTSPVRKTIEKDILLDLEKVLEKEPREASIRLLSVGCTGCLQDWYIVGQLIREGRTNIDLSIVDTEGVKECVEWLCNLSDALKAEGVNLTISFFDSIEKCAQQQKRPFHAAYGVNYFSLLTFKKNTWKNFSAVRKLLVPNGHFFVSYLHEIITVAANGKILVVQTHPHHQIIRNTIVAAQHANPRSKDCSLRVQLLSSDPVFIVGPLLYAVSDLLEEGYRDIMLYTFSCNLDWFSESDLSALFSDAAAAKGTATLLWKSSYYVHHKHEDRRDMVIFNLRGLELRPLIDKLNHDIILFGTIMPENGHWVVLADQLGLWDINGKGDARMLAYPSDNNIERANQLVKKLFAHGGNWY